MIKLKTILIENNILSPQPTKQYISELETWMKQWDYVGKSPRGQKQLHRDLNRIDGILKSMHEFNTIDGLFGQLKATLSYWNEDTIEDIKKYFSKNKIRIIKLKNTTFHNKSIMSEKRFIETSNYINKFLNDLKGFHKKALNPKLNIYFVKKKQTNASATYKSDKDIIFIRPDKVTNGNNYGSFVYVILHELGHRYEKYFDNYDIAGDSSWNTTKYSASTNSWHGEQFAELFALSHWYSKYKNKYQETMDKFLDIMK